VIVDKNPLIRTVINKVDNVGAEDAYRTFQYEVLAGEDDMDVQVLESGCVFAFNYAKVYWNSRLETEHSRLVRLFRPGEVVCDVMAGIGPFAVPAGKKGVFVWANDMNPESYKCLLTAIEKNKVSSVTPNTLSLSVRTTWLNFEIGLPICPPLQRGRPHLHQESSRRRPSGLAARRRRKHSAQAAVAVKGRARGGRADGRAPAADHLALRHEPPGLGHRLPGRL